MDRLAHGIAALRDRFRRRPAADYGAAAARQRVQRHLEAEIGMEPGWEVRSHWPPAVAKPMFTVTGEVPNPLFDPAAEPGTPGFSSTTGVVAFHPIRANWNDPAEVARREAVSKLAEALGQVPPQGWSLERQREERARLQA